MCISCSAATIDAGAYVASTLRKAVKLDCSRCVSCFVPGLTMDPAKQAFVGLLTVIAEGALKHRPMHDFELAKNRVLPALVDLLCEIDGGSFAEHSFQRILPVLQRLLAATDGDHGIGVAAGRYEDAAAAESGGNATAQPDDALHRIVVELAYRLAKCPSLLKACVKGVVYALTCSVLPKDESLCF